jgi:hypothetical protein
MKAHGTEDPPNRTTVEQKSRHTLGPQAHDEQPDECRVFALSHLVERRAPQAS